MKILVLTSSRADYGIYRPLLMALKNDPYFDLEIVAFGTHMSRFFGKSVDKIFEDGFKVNYQLETMIQGDTPDTVNSNMALTFIKFSGLWKMLFDKIDIAFCLGDRYEMFSAVSASVPYNIPLAHIHGGETTLGAIDNIFRHAITQMSTYHFTSTAASADRVHSLIGSSQNVYYVGAMSLDNLKRMSLYTIDEFKNLYGIDLRKPTILFTFHPESIHPEKNARNIREILDALDKASSYQIVITMPNADTKNMAIRSELDSFVQQHQERAYKVENFGTKGYFSCMEYCRFILGNSSSGIIEGASFGKYVLNLGDRQKGREAGSNVFHIKIDKESILKAILKVENSPAPDRHNIYWNGGATEKIISVLKTIGKRKRDAYEVGLLC